MSVWDESPLPPPVAGTPAAPPPPGRPPDAPFGPGDDPDDEPGDRSNSPRRVLGLPTRVAAVLLLAVCLVVAAVLVFTFGSDGGTADPDATDEPTGSRPSAPATSASPTTAPPSTVPPPTTSPPTSAAGTTSPVTTTPVTDPVTTSTAVTTPEGTTPEATTPVGTSTGPATAVGPEGQRLTVTPRRGPCGSATDCLVVSFTIDGFATLPQTFVCEFASGRRYEFRFSGDGVERACATNDVPDSIVIEVGGVRSDPVTNVG